MTESTPESWQELLPWYVNGTLEPEQARKLEQAMAANDDLKQEMLWLRQLQSGIQQQEQPAPPAELGWQRLKREIKRDKSTLRRRWGVGAATAATIFFSVQMGMIIKTDERPLQVMSGSQQLQNLEGYWQVQVSFVADTRVADIQQWAAPLGVRIIDGPSALGLYQLAIPKQGTTSTQTDLEHWLEQQSLLEHTAVLE